MKWALICGNEKSIKLYFRRCYTWHCALEIIFRGQKKANRDPYLYIWENSTFVRKNFRISLSCYSDLVEADVLSSWLALILWPFVDMNRFLSILLNGSPRSTKLGSIKWMWKNSDWTIRMKCFTILSLERMKWAFYLEEAYIFVTFTVSFRYYGMILNSKKLTIYFLFVLW